MKRKKKVLVSIAIIISLLLGWALFFHYYPVEKLVNDIGIRNTYFAAFMFAVIGGFSFVTGTSLYAALIALARGGVNPYMLGLIAGGGIFISDSLFYFVATKMRSVITSITSKWERVFRRIWKVVYQMPPWIVYTAIFLYAAFAPIPNDILLAVLALSGYNYREFAVFLFLGDMVMTLLLTTIGANAYM
jgi:hypothetical protein